MMASSIPHLLFSIFPLTLTYLFTKLKDRFTYTESYFFHNQNWHKNEILLFVVTISIFLSIEILLKHHYILIYWTFTKYVLLFGLLYWVFFIKHKTNLNTLGISHKKTYLNIFIGFIFYLAFYLGPAFVLSIFPNINFINEMIQYYKYLRFIEWPIILIVLSSITTILLAPIFEEIIFRSFLYAYLYKKIGIIGSSITTSLVWALYHPNIKAIIPIFLLGNLFCYMNVKSGSIVPSLTMHILLNSTKLSLYLVSFI